MARRPIIASLLLALLATSPAFAETPEHYEQVYLTQAQALRVAIPDAEKVTPRPVTPTAEERKQIERRLGRRLEETSFVFHEGTRGGKTIGYALVVDEIGKYYPITFIVGIKPNGEVREVAVMVYRERRGDAVRRGRFLNQFDGKSSADPLMVNRDITHLTGATVSSWSIAAGVKKALVLFEALIKP
jgi:Na+-translocating ferredoxin:NAD+ oxidoreductase RnfG subunit